MLGLGAKALLSRKQEEQSHPFLRYRIKKLHKSNFLCQYKKENATKVVYEQMKGSIADSPKLTKSQN